MELLSRRAGSADLPFSGRPSVLPADTRRALGSGLPGGWLSSRAMLRHRFARRSASSSRHELSPIVAGLPPICLPRVGLGPRLEQDMRFRWLLNLDAPASARNEHLRNRLRHRDHGLAAQKANSVCTACVASDLRPAHARMMPEDARLGRRRPAGRGATPTRLEAPVAQICRSARPCPTSYRRSAHDVAADIVATRVT
jgi:hypothetical protein